MAKILVLHGPNLNMLGLREPEVYGTTTLKEIDEQIKLFAETAGHKLVTFQSNAEHELIDRIQSAKTKNIDFIIINPGAFTHTSIAIRDAFLSVSIPFIEVHLSNVFAREEFRKHSYLSDIAVAVVSGMGAFGYEVALQAAEQLMETAEREAEKCEDEDL
jgi:3-dehydroquinate dehydratase-2